MTALLDYRFGEDESEECASGVHRTPRAVRSPFDLPVVPGIEQAASRIHAEDERELRWRLANPLLSSMNGVASMAAWLARAESYGYGALPCRKCGGAWRKRRRRKDGVEIVVGWRDGTGWMPRAYRSGKRPTYAQALATYRVQQCREHRIVVISHHPDDPTIREATIEAFWARGEQVVTPSELRDMFPVLPEEASEACTNCQGIGVVPRRGSKQGEVTV